MLTTRRATAADLPAVLTLLRDSLNKDDDPRYDEFFRWKHRENAFGASPSWLAEEGGEVLGFRTFMRWQFRSEGHTLRAVRAVDTATAKKARGRGIFRTLTEQAVGELEAEGVDLVFNTPNDQSRPGYLKMGWQVVGKLPVSVDISSLASGWRTARSRTAAELWSLPTTVGQRVPEVPDEAWHRLDPAGPGLSTERTPSYYRWRYGFTPLAYRVVTAGDAMLVFRLRRRGEATELAVCEHQGSRTGMRRLVRQTLRRTNADYAIRLGSGGIPLPRQGPILTCRTLGDTPRPAEWRLSLGDVELF